VIYGTCWLQEAAANLREYHLMSARNGELLDNQNPKTTRLTAWATFAEMIYYYGNYNKAYDRRYP